SAAWVRGGSLLSPLRPVRASLSRPAVARASPCIACPPHVSTNLDVPEKGTSPPDRTPDEAHFGVQTCRKSSRDSLLRVLVNKSARKLMKAHRASLKL